MTTTFTLIAGLIALIALPLIILLWATESPQQRARRWRRDGLTYRAIGSRLSVSHTTARRYCLA